MRVELGLADSRKVTIELESEQALNDLLNGAGAFETGWAMTKTGEYVRLSQVVSVRPRGAG